MEEKEIILAKICAILDKPYFIIKENGEFKKYLKCCGLGKLYDDNADYLEPYWYNGTWQNPREEYNIFIGLDNIFTELLKSNETKKLSLLIVELGNNINPYITSRYYEDDRCKKYVDKLINLYQLLGFELVKETDYFDVIPWSGNTEKIADVYGLEQWLLNNYPEIYDSYEGSIDAFVSGNFGTCIEACRTTLTGLFSKYKGPDSFAKWFRGTADIAGEYDGSNMQDIKNHLDALGKRELSEFFEENISGSYKKTRAIYSIYSMLSDYGTHRQEGTEETPSKEDALMMLRMTEDIMIWIFQKRDS
ncbi:hypothetical protein C8E03_102551 [Lachnotalea glycerini]|uniref:Uncharacterized protein n=1 Tax=Lachnotalea glycerini TaxID=1763509 RepID=A0A318ERZ5_9FIRM|nr:hypothetical protein [Lachnotalea glycerini]PXV93776.1 hypothetical protein C8E03_102551 [Lachnotalea glycerini]